MIVCGPVALKERVAAPDAALSIATDDPAARERAWKQIENADGEGQDAAEMGEMEPSARRSG